MSEQQKTDDPQYDARAKVGLEILYTRLRPEDRVGDIAKRNLDGELRERYWIRQAQDAGIKKGESWTDVEISMPWPIERHELGRTRDEPGDGFRYVFRGGTSGTEGRTEWFEVTEVFEGVNPRDIKTFMRMENGMQASAGFDRVRFLKELDLTMPSRAAQRRAADAVIRQVERKLSRRSYDDLWKPHGYGTLIVGLPLWFATAPLNPLRVENVIDNFETRVRVGLEPYARQLRKKTCPFWRIVVVWNGSIESMEQWYESARLDVYDDPAWRQLKNLPIRVESMTPTLLTVLRKIEAYRQDGGQSGGLKRHVVLARPNKLGNETSVRLPPALAQWKRILGEHKALGRQKLHERLKWQAKSRVLHLVCFLRAFGWNGLERWVAARLSPDQRISRWVMRRKASRFYRASRR